MEEHKSKSSQLTHWAAHHTAWEFTGASVAHFIREEIKAYLRPFLGGSVITGGITYGVNHLGVAGPWLIAATLLTFGIVMLGWDILARAYQNKKPLLDEANTLSEDRTLVIVSARWGIGGDAYQDVTNVVRRNAKLDSLNMPASIGLLGDPYERAPKHLRIVYLVGRRWEISVPEWQTAVLPEKDGEEQQRKEEELLHKDLDSKRAYVKKLQQETQLSAADTRTHNALKSEFDAMPWAQKLTLHAIYRSPGMDLGSLVRNIEGYGFGQDAQNDIVIPLIDQSRFVDAKDRRHIERHPLNYKFVEEFLDKWENYPF